MPCIALFDTEDDTVPKSIEVTWEELQQSLSVPVYTQCNPCAGHSCEAKKGKAWAPSTFVEGAQRRLADNVVSINFGVFDLDDPNPEAMATLAAALDGYAYIAHETHSGGFRIIVPFSEPVPASEWPQVWPALVAKFKLPADQKCKDPSRLYFIPSRPEGSTYAYYTGVGRPVAWRTDLDLVFSSAGAALRTFTQGIEAQRADLLKASELGDRVEHGPIDLEALRRAVAALRRGESKQLLDTILGGRRLTEQYPQDEGYRDDTINRAMSLLATAPSGKAYAVETVMALIRPCIVSMRCAPEGEDFWLAKAENSYLRALGRRLDRDTRNEADKAALLKIIGREPNKVVEGSDDEWRKGLLYVVDAHGEPSGLRQVGANINLILTHDKEFREQIRFNEVTKAVDIHGGVLANVPRSTLETEAANWLARSEYRLYVRSFDVGEQLLAVARQNSYDPVRDWLLGLKWDGKFRCNTFFRDYLSAEPAFGYEDLLDKLSACFLISMVARGLSPGCECHVVPVLAGKQGVGKTRSLKALGGAYFSNTKLDLNNKDAKIAASQFWLIELAELASVRKQDVETVKGFLSQSFDDFRPPYGRVIESFQRHCVFAGTTNSDEFLFDETGNRRFWPIRVGKCYPELIERDREQLFAEAVVRYQQGEQWWLAENDSERQEFSSRAFMVPSVRAEQIVKWFVEHAEKDRPKCMTSFECARFVLQISEPQIDDRTRRDIGRALTMLGFTRTRKRLAGKPLWYYETPADLMKVPTKAKPLPEGMEAVTDESERPDREAEGTGS